MDQTIKLYKKEDQIFVKTGDVDEPVTAIVRVRPLSTPDAEISILGKKGEIAFINSIDELDVESKKIVQQELEAYYQFNAIEQVISADTSFGTRYMTVATNRGKRSFAFKNPYLNVRRIDNTVFIRDVVGNTYQITDYKGLDEKSKDQVERIL